MNLIDAIKSGKRFRRQGWDKGVFIRIKNGFLVYADDDCCWSGSQNASNILADDWEVETVRKELSADDVLKAYETAKYKWRMCDADGLDRFRDLLLKELGL